MRIADIFGVIRRGTEKNGNFAVIILINVCKANPLAVGSESKVVIAHQKFAVRRAVGAVVAFHLLAKSCRQVLDNALFAYQTGSARFLCRRNALF